MFALQYSMEIVEANWCLRRMKQGRNGGEFADDSMAA